MRILLAGGAGFIGYHLTRQLLQRRDHVLVVDNLSSGTLDNIDAIRREFPGARYEARIADVRTLRLPDPAFDAVLNLASAASPVDYTQHPLETLEAGSLGTRNLLHIAHAAGARFLLTSTSEVYGDPEVHPQPESYWGHVNPIGPRSMYDEAKRFAEAYATSFARVHGVPVRIARIFNTYGPRMRPGDGRVISTFLAQALRCEPITIHGDGKQTRSYCYVEDMARGLLRLLESDLEGPVNLGNPEELTVFETAQRVLEATHSPSPIVHVKRMADDPERRRPDITRARTQLGWEPRIPFRQGLARTAEAMAETLGVRPFTGLPASRFDGARSSDGSPRPGAPAMEESARLRRTGMS